MFHSTFLRTIFPMVAIAAAALAARVAAEPVLFVFAGAPGNQPPQSFVVPVEDAAQIAQVRSYLADRAAGRESRPLVATVRVAAGGDGINRNYAAPGAPEWPWRVSQVVGFTRYTWPAVEPAIFIPARDGMPSTVSELLQAGANPPSTVWFGEPGLIALRNFPLQMQLDRAKAGAVSNVSNRGYVAAGERALIAGFVVEGGAPRNVVVRGLGPSLRAFGVTEPLADPRIEIYLGAEKIAENDNWNTGSLNRPHPAVVPPPSPFHLIPSETREAAVELSLAPGAYTVVLRGADGGAGIALLEVYDLSAASR